MHTTMLEAPGVGLAATQIGSGLALAVVEDHVRDDEDDPREIAEFPFHVIINPSYKPTSDKTASFYEGCLSFDGYQAVRKRWLDITAEWDDEDGKHHSEPLHGWPARIFQHETDHLSGETVYRSRRNPFADHQREPRGLLGAKTRCPPRPLKSSVSHYDRPCMVDAAKGDIPQSAASMPKDADGTTIDWDWVRSLDLMHGMAYCRHNTGMLEPYSPSTTH